MDDDTPMKVAIACQGGGSHTAFTAGALDRLLEDHRTDYRITAFSGTSGGAVCALAAWYGLRTGENHSAGVEKAQALLEQVWDDIKAESPVERLSNGGLVQLQRFAEMGAPIPRIAPKHNPFTAAGENEFRSILEEVADADAIEALVGDLPADDSTDTPEPPSQPWLYVSAVDAVTGSFEIFSDRPEVSGNPAKRAKDIANREDAHDPHAALEGVSFRHLYSELLTDGHRPLTLDAIVASAAVPTLFSGVELENDDDGIYWDGLFSQNPPVRNLLRGIEDKSKKPDEIWLIRINPTVHRRSLDELEDIFDRRNELSGSLSLNQELHYIRRMNEWVDEGRLQSLPDDDSVSDDSPSDDSAADQDRYKPVKVRLIELDSDGDSKNEGSSKLTPASKLDRRPEHIDSLKAMGRVEAEQFLASYRKGEKNNVIVGAEPKSH